MTGIGEVRESSLHAALKQWYSQPNDQFEQSVEGFIIDILRENCVIEIQTGNFHQLKKKLERLGDKHSVIIAYPIPVERNLVRIDIENGGLLRRRSPKKGRLEEIFNQLIYILPLLKKIELSLDLLLVRDEIWYINDGKGSWRREKWSVADRKLIEVTGRLWVPKPADLIGLLPPGLPEFFSSADVMRAGVGTIATAQRMVYCLHHLGMLERAGKKDRYWLYHRL